MDYESLRYLPKINGVTVIGDRTIEDFGMVEMSSSDVDSNAATDEGGAPTKDISELSDSGEQSSEDKDDWG